MAAIQIHHADGTLCLASVGDLSVTLVHRSLTAAQLEPLRRIARSQARLYNSAARTMTVIESDAMSVAVPDEVRRETESLMTIPSLAVAIVIEATGFAAATVRTLLSGVTMVKRVPSKVKIFGAVSEGARWLSQSTVTSPHGPLSETVVFDLVAAARSAVEAPRASSRVVR